MSVFINVIAIIIGIGCIVAALAFSGGAGNAFLAILGLGVAANGLFNLRHVIMNVKSGR